MSNFGASIVNVLPCGSDGVVVLCRAYVHETLYHGNDCTLFVMTHLHLWHPAVLCRSVVTVGLLKRWMNWPCETILLSGWSLRGLSAVDPLSVNMCHARDTPLWLQRTIRDTSYFVRRCCMNMTISTRFATANVCRGMPVITILMTHLSSLTQHTAMSLGTVYNRLLSVTKNLELLCTCQGLK